MTQMGKMGDPIKLDRISKGKVVVSWTGGKDGCYACYKAITEGYQVTYLMNFRNTKKFGSHKINPMVIQAQSQAIGISSHSKGLSFL